MAKPEKKWFVRALRPFFHEGVTIMPGHALEVPEGVAAMVIEAQRAKLVTEEEAKAVPFDPRLARKPRPDTSLATSRESGARTSEPDTRGAAGAPVPAGAGDRK